MNLKSIQIQAYKSILNQSIMMNENCIGFVGLNESGKTNILKAIQHLDVTLKFSIKDKSKINNETPLIRYSFSVTSGELDLAKKSLNDHLLNKFPFVGNQSVIDDLIINSVTVTKKLIIVETNNETKIDIETDYKVELNNKYVEITANEEIAADATIKYEEQDYLVADNYFLKALIENDRLKYFTSVKNEDFDKEIVDFFSEYMRKLIPIVKYWEYDDQFLIPAEIAYTSFMQNDDPYANNAPLFNMMLVSDELNILDSNDLKRKIDE